MKKSTEIVLAWELYEQGLSKSAIARQLGRDRETVRIWIAGVERYGLKSFVDKSTKCLQSAASFSPGGRARQALGVDNPRT